MANTKISDLTASAANLASTDLAPVVQTPGVGPVKMTGLQLAGGLLGSATFNGSTVTTSQPVLDLSQTWNAGAVAFTGLKFNATDTASASGSLLLDLQVGGASKASITKAGVATFTGKVVANNSSTTSGGVNSDTYYATNFFNVVSGGVNCVYLNSSAVWLRSTNTLQWTNGDAAGGIVDLILTRAAAATLQLGAANAAAPVAQTLQVQSVVAGTTNTAGANFTIKGSAGTGTGAGGSIIFQVAPAGTTGTAQNAYSTALTLGNVSGNGWGSYAYTPNGTNWLFVGGDGNNYPGVYTSTGAFVVRTAQYTNMFSVNTVGIHINATAGVLSFGGGYSTNTSGDVILARDAANTLALRNGTSTQKFRVYNTYTSSTNYENFEIDWQTTANIALVGPTKGSGGGTQRVQRLQYLEDGGAGSTTPSLGTTCPAASATIKSWIKVITSDGTTAYIPCWA